MQLTRDPYKAYNVWTHADEGADVMAELRHALIDFIHAKMEPIRTADDLIDLQLARIGDTDRFAIGVPGGPDDALRLPSEAPRRLLRPTG